MFATNFQKISYHIFIQNKKSSEIRGQSQSESEVVSKSDKRLHHEKLHVLRPPSRPRRARLPVPIASDERFLLSPRHNNAPFLSDGPRVPGCSCNRCVFLALFCIPLPTPFLLVSKPAKWRVCECLRCRYRLFSLQIDGPVSWAFLRWLLQQLQGASCLYFMTYWPNSPVAPLIINSTPFSRSTLYSFSAWRLALDDPLPTTSWAR